MIHVTGRIDPRAVFEYLEMNVGSGSSSRAAHQSNDLSGRYVIAGADDYVIIVGVAGAVAIPMIDFHRFAVSGTICGPNHDTARYAKNFSALGTRKIKASVFNPFTGKRIISFTEPRRDPAFSNRPTRWREVAFQLPVNHQELQGIKLGGLAAQFVAQGGNSESQVFPCG